MNYAQLKKECLRLGFVETTDELSPLAFRLTRDDVAQHVTMFYSACREQFYMIASSALESVYLNTQDPAKVIEWGKMIFSVEPEKNLSR